MTERRPIEGFHTGILVLEAERGYYTLEMFRSNRNRVEESRHGNLCMPMVMLLCLCVVVHFLGAPVTLMNPIEVADTMAASVLEGFSVPQTVPQLTLLFETIRVAVAQPSMHVPVLTSVLFHPPRL